jgi:peptide/nickel transport system permease protein
VTASQQTPAMVVTQAGSVATARTEPRGVGAFARRFARHRGAMVGLIVLVIVVIVAIVGPIVAPFDPYKSDASSQLAAPGTKGHLLGADHLGRDVASRIVHGASLSLQIGLISVTVAVVFGVLLGLPAGYRGGGTDMAVMRGVDVLLAFPSILLALSIVSVLGPGLGNAMIAVGISVIPLYVRVVRASALSTREQQFVEAARVTGMGDLEIMIRHVFPHVLGPLVIIATLGVATAIIIGASLSFLSLGAQPPLPEWGAMLSEGRGFLQTAWWMSVFPGLAIMGTVLAINLVGDGLRDMLDPRMHRR